MQQDKRKIIQLSRANKAEHGFTLLELLVAIVIFAIMAVMAYGGLNNVINNSKAATRSLNRLQQLQHAVAVLNRDFGQIRNRSIRDAFGVRRAYLLTGNNIDNLVEFSRGGRLNPANLKRSSLERVAYRFQNNKLIRLQWPFMDRAPGTKPRQSILLDKVKTVTLRFYDRHHQWHNQWPPLNSSRTSNTGSKQNLPTLIAIEINFTLDDWGKIRRLYAVQI